jgi:hypothetical protein
MNVHDQSMYESLRQRKQLLPEVTFGLPVVSLVFLGFVWGIQLSELPETCAEWLGWLRAQCLWPTFFRRSGITSVEPGAMA